MVSMITILIFVQATNIPSLFFYYEENINTL
jgi:hypothetical protein